VYPDVLVQYNVLKKDSFFVKLWAQTNRTVFAKANHLYTIGSGMKTLVANYISENKVAIVPIWSDNEFLKPIERCDNLFIKKYQLEEKFVIMYSGNLGKTHPVEILLEIAFELNHESVEVFVIGEGEKKKALISAAEKRDITNIHFLPYQDVAYFPISLAASDLSVVTLSNEAAQLSVPSKIFNIMSVKAPILAIGGSESELAYLLKTHENGADFNESQMVEILKFVRKLMNDKCFYNLLATNSLKASLMYTPINANRLKF
jgi:glycosyltransferase involved in cell wall biosynthesis